jgi:hypothetical protein
MSEETDTPPMSGKIPFALGTATIIRIPVPGSGGLGIELRPRGYVPAGGSTSTLFIQNVSGKRHLRLYYGYDITTKTIDYHWNQKGTFPSLGITDHTPAGKTGQMLYRGARYFRHAGRVLVVTGAALELVSITVASKPPRRATQVVTAWAAAWLGCKVVGAGGAAGGTLVTPGAGTAVGGFVGCVVGGIGGYLGGEHVGGVAYDWAEDTLFIPLPEVAAP